MPPTWLVLLLPPLPAVPDKTARLYTQLRNNHYSGGQVTDDLVTRLKKGGRILIREPFNVFDNVAPEVFPGLETYRQKFLMAGTQKVCLAGAGPVIFALADDRFNAEAIYHKLKSSVTEVYLAVTGVFGDGGPDVLQL